MLQPVIRLPPAPPIHAIAAHGYGIEREAGRLSAEQTAAEVNFAKPLGAAQATMEKISAIAADAKSPPQPEPRGQWLDMRA